MKYVLEPPTYPLPYPYQKLIRKKKKRWLIFYLFACYKEKRSYNIINILNIK